MLTNVSFNFLPRFFVVFGGDKLDCVELLLLAMIENGVYESAADAALLVLRVDGHATKPSDAAWKQVDAVVEGSSLTSFKDRQV